MNYEKYYTPYLISELLVNQIETDIQPSTTIDICCGSCNLLKAAKIRWPNIKASGVDIEEIQIADIVCIQSDGRRFAQRNAKKYSIVLANPPFESLKIKNEYPSLSNGIIKDYSTSRLENEMLLANLQLLDENGILMAIMPSTFVEGITNQSLRIAIASKFHLQKIIRLPDSIFGSSRIKSYAVILQKNNNNQDYTQFQTILNDNGTYKITQSCVIEKHYVRSGIWLGNDNSEVMVISLDIKRGNLSSQSLSKQRNIFSVLHTSKYSDDWSASLRYINELPLSAIFAKNGDIVFSRIGKSAGCWFEYIGDTIAISDCLYRIGNPSRYLKKAITGKKYTGIIRGVSTPYITKGDIQNWFSSVCTDI